MAPSRHKRNRASGGSYPWATFDDEHLAAVRFRDLRLRLRDSPLWNDVQSLYSDLQRRGVRFRPHVWLSTEWFSPDGIPGIAAPFYAAHPRLRRLERHEMGEVEGGSRHWRLRILRHEAGHALDTAYGLRRRGDWREVFGKASKPYPRDYTVRPGSRRYVLHLGHWYAQSHPTEDFAETFAVWLQPKARWRRAYKGWPALEKLEYVDELMAEIAARAPRNRNRSVVAPLSENTRTLQEHYRRKHPHSDFVDKRYDSWLQSTFDAREDRPRATRASRFIREFRSPLRRALVRRTGVGHYLVDHVVDTVRRRARELDLALAGTQRDQLPHVISLLEEIISDVLRRNREKYIL
jgi:hypothetical protein